MKKDMEQIDNLIRQALSEEETRFYEELNEPNLLGKLEQVYRGKMGWLAVVMNLVTLLLFVVFIFSTVRFFNSELPEELIKWAAVGFLCLTAIGMLKLYIWMQMDSHDLKRELKRIELQIAVLSSKMGP